MDLWTSVEIIPNKFKELTDGVNLTSLETSNRVDLLFGELNSNQAEIENKFIFCGSLSNKTQKNLRGLQLRLRTFLHRFPWQKSLYECRNDAKISSHAPDRKNYLIEIIFRTGLPCGQCKIPKISRDRIGSQSKHR